MGNESMLSPSKGICCICCQGGGVGPQLPLHVPVTALHQRPASCPGKLLHDLGRGGKNSKTNLKYSI